ncbi:MAG TPA: hypothetical protein VK563_11885 [Puia sp.]|nr:hypothetical protein [Puia sp.]
MKKLFTILAVAVAMTACNNSGESSNDSTAKAAADTVKAATDSGMKKMDSMPDSSKMKMSADTSSKTK